MGAHDFIKRGDLRGLREWVNNGGDVDELNEEGESALYLAVQENPASTETLRALLEAGANPSFIFVSIESDLTDDENEEMRLLYKQNSEGDLRKVKRFVPDNIRWILMEYAFSNCSVEQIELLRQFGAHIDFLADENGTAALSAACNEVHALELIDYIYHEGLPLDTISGYGGSAPSNAYQCGNAEVLDKLFRLGASDEALNWTPLHKAVFMDTVEEVKAQLTPEYLTAYDHEGYAPIHVAIRTGQWDKYLALTEHKDSAAIKTKRGKSHLEVATEHRQVDVLTKFLALTPSQGDLNAALDYAITFDYIPEAQLLIQAGAIEDRERYFGWPLIDQVRSREMLQLLRDSGFSIEQIGTGGKRWILGLEDLDWDSANHPSRDEFDRFNRPRAGTSNPEEITDPFKLFMISWGWGPGGLRTEFDIKPIYEGNREPIWCFDRMGQSITLLPDGRYVLIGGEHEDFYDPDFCIYNDVTVFEPNGEIRVYGYPGNVFPCTDFHSATLVGDWIYIIGCLGYQHQRSSRIPVYRLSIHDFHIEWVKTGGDIPGRIYDHRAHLIYGNRIRIEGGKLWTGQKSASTCGVGGDAATRAAERKKRQALDRNKDVFELDLTTLQWSKLP